MNEYLQPAPAKQKNQLQPVQSESKTEPVPTTTPHSYVDTNKFRQFYLELLSIYGGEKAARIARQTYEEDLVSLSWEALKLVVPYEHYYKIVETEVGTKLIHRSDEHWQKDILDGVSPHFRRGLEYKGISGLKKAVLRAKKGHTRFLDSNMWDEWEESGPFMYTDSQFNFLEVVEDSNGEKLVMVRQFQSNELTRERSIKLYNQLTQGRKLSDGTKVDNLITSVGRTERHLTDLEILQGIANVTEQSLDLDQFKRHKIITEKVKLKAHTGAQSLLKAVESGYEGEDLEVIFRGILKDTIGQNNLLQRVREMRIQEPVVDGRLAVEIMTSCGVLSFDLTNAREGFGWRPSFISLSSEKKCKVCNEKKEEVACGYCKKCAK